MDRWDEYAAAPVSLPTPEPWIERLLLTLFGVAPVSGAIVLLGLARPGPVAALSVLVAACCGLAFGLWLFARFKAYRVCWERADASGVMIPEEVRAAHWVRNIDTGDRLLAIVGEHMALLVPRAEDLPAERLDLATVTEMHEEDRWIEWSDGISRFRAIHDGAGVGRLLTT